MMLIDVDPQGQRGYRTCLLSQNELVRDRTQVSNSPSANDSMLFVAAVSRFEKYCLCICSYGQQGMQWFTALKPVKHLWGRLGAAGGHSQPTVKTKSIQAEEGIILTQP